VADATQRSRLKTMASHAARCSDVTRRFPVIVFVTCGSVVPTTILLPLCLPISRQGSTVPGGGVGRFRGGAASWLFCSRRQALILLEHCTACFARPNVRVEAGSTVLLLARAVHHVPQAPRGQGAMPLGLASNEGLGLARCHSLDLRRLRSFRCPLRRLAAPRWRGWHGGDSSRRDR